LLARCHGRKATGERNAVFALLSLAEDTSPRDWNIDYKISALDVYQEAVANIIRTGSLDIICQASSYGASCHPHFSLLRFGSSPYRQMSGIPQKTLSMSLEGETLLLYQQRETINFVIVLLEIQSLQQGMKKIPL
jgi:hypothetical protein